MKTNRRIWLKQVGLSTLGMGLATMNGFASSVGGIDDAGSGADDPIILRSNENPYGPSPLARKVIANNLAISNRYNWGITADLISEIARKNNVRDENVLLGAGSTEILDWVASFASSETGNYVIADPSYDYWTIIFDHFGLRKVKVPLTADKRIDLPAMQNAIGRDTRLIYICNPNNPTGTLCEREALVEFVNRVPENIIVLIDEAYLEYTRQASLSALVGKLPNLVIAKTFSKIYGLAGARIGYALADKVMIDRLANLQSAPNNSVSVLSKLAALASLKDERFVSECYTLNESARQYTIAELEKLQCRCIPSATNFIYFSLENFRKDYFSLLDDHNIQGTRIYEGQGRWTRITVGTMAEMKHFVRAIQ